MKTPTKNGLSGSTQPLVIDNSQDSPCQSVTIRDILEQYPTGYRGGTHDSHGRSADRRGGSAETEDASRYHQEAAARGADTRLQARGCVASQVSRPGEIYRGSEVQEEELISVSSAATQHSAITIGTRLTERCYSLLLHVHYSLLDNARQHLATLYNAIVGYEVAVGGIAL